MLLLFSFSREGGGEKKKPLGASVLVAVAVDRVGS